MTGNIKSVEMLLKHLINSQTRYLSYKITK